MERPGYMMQKSEVVKKEDLLEGRNIFLSRNPMKVSCRVSVHSLSDMKENHYSLS